MVQRDTVIHVDITHSDIYLEFFATHAILMKVVTDSPYNYGKVHYFRKSCSEGYKN
jgi:hypothetical protein